MSKILIIPFFSLLLMLSSVFAAELNSQKGTFCAGKRVLGRVERVILIGKNIPMDAKLDTGAGMTSLSARHILIFNRYNKSWVRFVIYLPATGKHVTFVEPLIKFTRILQRKEEMNGRGDFFNKNYDIRPVIILPICIGNRVKPILVNLIDRTDFRYPMLIGSDTLRKFSIIVDASQKYQSSPQCVKVN